MEKRQMKDLKKVNYEDVLEYVEGVSPINEDNNKRWDHIYSVLLEVSDKEDIDILMKSSNSLYAKGIGIFRYKNSYLIGLLKEFLQPGEYNFVKKYNLDFSPEGSLKEMVKDIIDENQYSCGTTEITKSIGNHDSREVKMMELYDKITENMPKENNVYLIINLDEVFLSVEVLNSDDYQSIFYGVEDDDTLVELLVETNSSLLIQYNADLIDGIMKNGKEGVYHKMI